MGWISHKTLPEIERGTEIPAWVLIQYYKRRYSHDVSNFVTDAEPSYRVQLMMWENTDASSDEIEALESLEDDAEFPSWMQEYQNEDGEFLGYTGFYHEYNEEGHCQRDYYRTPGQLDYSIYEKDLIIAWQPIDKPGVPEDVNKWLD